MKIYKMFYKSGKCRNISKIGISWPMFLSENDNAQISNEIEQKCFENLNRFCGFLGCTLMDQC